MNGRVVALALLGSLAVGGCYLGLGPDGATESDTEGTGTTVTGPGMSAGPGDSSSPGTGGTGGTGPSSDTDEPTTVTATEGSADSSSDGGPEPDEVELMCSRWTSDRADMSEGTWSGNVVACDAGDISVEGRANALRILNLNRWMVGLPEVTTDPMRNAMAQECALMMDANGALSHSPPMDWTCFSSDGANAAGSSNISTGPGVMSVDLYMVDPGNTTTLGHRRWILSNSAGPVGLGTTSSYSCMWVLGGSGGGANEWTAWPSPGPFPLEGISPLGFASINDTGWSLQSDSIDLNGATVAITVGGEPRPVTVNTLAGGYGSDTAIAMIPNGWTAQPDTTYHVLVDGVAGGPIEYDVQIVDCG